MSDVFISYASADRERAKRLAEALQARGYSAWWDRQIAPGQTFDEVIEKALNDAKCVVVLWSATSVRSDWVKTEASEAARRKILVPALIDRVTIPLEFRRIQAADLTQWDGRTDDREFEKFLAAVDVELQEWAAPTPHATQPPRSVDSRSGAAVAMAPEKTPVARPGSRPQPAAESPRRGIGKWLLAAVALLAAIAGSVFLLNRQGEEQAAGSEVAGIQVPSVVGTSYEAGAAALTAANLIPERQEKASDVYLPGIIFEQLPAAGTMLTKDTKVTLTVASSVNRVPAAETKSDTATNAPAAVTAPPVIPVATVPDLKGQNAERAAELLAGAGLKLGEKKGVANNDAPFGTIVAQEPEPGQSRAKDSAVTITLVTKRKVPELTKLNLQNARDVLAKLGLSDQLERVQAARGQADDTVVMQVPAAGTEIESSEPTRLTIATVTPRKIFGGDDLYKDGLRKCVQICKENGLAKVQRWIGNSDSPRNTCFCSF
jgi:beta-lactam-binding protein with PASTA domain